MTKTKKTKGKKDIHIKRNLRMYYELAKPYKWYFIAIVATVLLASGASVADKFVFKVLIDEGTKFTSGLLEAGAFVQILVLLAIAFFLLLLIRTSMQWLKLHITNIFSTRMMYDLKRKFFNHIVHLDHEFHTTHKTGSLISKLTRGSWAIDGITDFFVFNGAPLVLKLVVVGASVLYFDIMSAFVLVVMSTCFITYSIIMINKQRKLRVIANAAEDREKANIGDVFTNIDSIKYYGKEETVKNHFASLAKDTKKKFRKNWDFYRWLDSGQTLIIGIGLFFLIYFPLMKFLDGGITIGTLAFLYTVFFSLAEPLFGFVWGVRHLYESMANIEGLFDYDKAKNRIKDKPNAPELKVKEGKIEFKNVSFAYNRKKELAVHNLNLKINKNEKVALVGHSGCGKTTLIRLLYRLYDIQKGEILIDGKNIKDFKQESLRGELSVVPQECVLFDDTIYNNIKFSNPKATRKEVFRAMKFAQLDKFMNKLPKKEKTIVGERGIKLSGGEKQRVSIARAILAGKKVLILDEATSALDSKTEYEIQRDLKELMKGRTSIIIAHRLSTIMHADKIIVMKEGRVVQSGKHDELIKRRGVYRELWDLQKGGYIKE